MLALIVSFNAWQGGSDSGLVVYLGHVGDYWPWGRGGDERLSLPWVFPFVIPMVGLLIALLSSPKWF